MREYEFTYVVQPEISEEGITAISDRFEGILGEHDSEKIFYEDWGRRRLAYEIRNFQKGHYRVLHFVSDGKVVPELERAARLDDSVLRFLTVLSTDNVVDLEERREEGKRLEEERVQRATEKAQREAEEAARAAEEEAARAAEEAARAAAAPEPDEEAAGEAAEGATPEAAEEATEDAAPEATESAAPEADGDEAAEETPS